MPSIPDYFDEYQANKVDTTVEFMQARLDMLAESAPDWFKFEAGFRFVWDTSPSIYIGPGGHRDLSDFQPPSILFAFLYKGEWHACERVMEDLDVGDLMAVPGVSELVREFYNNEIIENALDNR